MANWGIQTWDAGGVPNNTGIVPVMVVGTVFLSSGQVSGTYSFSVPAGFTLAAIQSPISGASFSPARRKINVSGNSIVLTNAAGDYSAGTISAEETWLIVYLLRS